MKIIGIIGWKNSGKTYLAKKLISNFSKLNFSVASIKHAHHDFEIDKPNTDSFFHRKAGSSQVIISSAKRWAKITELNQFKEKKLQELIKELHKPDIVFVEGYKNENHPKIEIIKDPYDSTTFMHNNIKNIVAIISDIKIKSFNGKQFKKNEIKEITKFILKI